MAVLLKHGWFPMDNGSWVTPEHMWTRRHGEPLYVDSMSLERAWEAHRRRLDKVPVGA